MTIGVEGLLAALDAALDRLEPGIAGLRSIQDVDIETLHASLNEARGHVERLRAHATELATHAEVPSRTVWRDRRGYVEAIAILNDSLSVRQRLERERRRRAMIAEALELGTVTHPSSRLRAAYADLASSAVMALRGTLTSESLDVLAGPEDAPAWIVWARNAPEELRAVLPAEVIEFLQHVPKVVWRLASASASIRIDGDDETQDDQSELLAPAIATTGVAEVTVGPIHSVEESKPTRKPESTDLADVITEDIVPTNALASATLAKLTTTATPANLEAGDGPRDEDKVPILAWSPGIPDDATPNAIPEPPEVPQPIAHRLSEPPRASAADLALTPELQSFDAFRDAWWVSPSGRAETAPWCRPSFVGGLTNAFGDAIADPNPAFHVAWLMAAASEAVGHSDLPRPDDVVSLANLWSSPLLTSSASNPARVAHLREVDRSGAITESPATRLGLVLEALAPSLDLTLDEVESLTLFAGFKSAALRAVIAAMLRLAAQAEVPVLCLRDALNPPHKVDPGAVERRVKEARETLRSEFLRVQHAGGGNIERTHCREAWRDFIAAIDPTMQMLVDPIDRDAKALDEVSKRAREIAQMHRKIADKHGARLKDRHKMDRMAERLRDFAVAVVEGLRALVTAGTRRPALTDTSELVSAWTQLVATAPQKGDEEFSRRLLQRVIVTTVQSSNRTNFGITLEVLATRPDLTLSLGDIDLSELTSPAPPQAIVADIRNTTNPRHAAAVWIAGAQPSHYGGPLDGLLRALDQPHLRSCLGPFLALLPEAEQRRVHATRGVEEQRLWRSHERLHTAWRNLADLVVAIAPQVRHLLSVVAEVLENDPTRAHAPLFDTWIDAVSAHCEEAVGRAIRALLDSAETLDPSILSAVRISLDAGRYADAHRLLHETSSEHLHDDLRQTVFLFEARTRFPQPLAAIESLTTRTELATAWRRGVTGEMTNADRPLRTAFADAFFPSPELSRQNNPKELRVSCEDLRAWFRRKRLNPSFVPQLSRFRDLVVVTPPNPPHHSHFVQGVGSQVSNYDGHLVVVLAPNITARTRGDLAPELRRRGVASVIDDLDLCRLLNPGGAEPNLVIGLLEVLLEQQRWSSVTPFLLPDGQNVQMEMFVGRRDEARELARTARYSRLFSGRKLGKSALLRFVEATEDGYRLPSGRTLRVLYVSAVGVDSERALVQRIGEAMLSRFDLRIGSLQARGEQPSERLMELVQGFRAARKDDSLLVVLDEADAFVEQQTDAYERGRERCLSFFMRSQIEQERDTQGLPCVRFVFSGYRVTNTTEGTWANWGDVLRLAPLVPDDAADLVARPLARLGIDCSTQMRAIAHRCGHQPAVLLRFGEHLLTRMDGRIPTASRDTQRVEVSDDDITLTFEDDRIQDEIRTVVRNNFQGNPTGRVVFGAVLLAFLRQPPGHTLNDAEDWILTTLRDLSDGEMRWLGEVEASARGAIRMRLRDLVERQLLVERRTAGNIEPGYQLRFPHHLPTLMPLSQESGLREEIRSLKRAEGANEGAMRREVLSRADLEQIRELMSWDAVRTLSVVASLWPAALKHSSVGLPDRLGIDDDRVFKASSLMPWLTSSGVGQPRSTIVYDMTPDHLLKVVEATSPKQRLPVMTGGVDLLRWASRAQVPSECPWGDSVCVEPFAQGRWSLATVSWWFARVRGVNFPRPDAVEIIARYTSGIGFLVRLFDELLLGEAGASEGQDITPDAFDLAIALYERRFASHVRSLIDGDEAMRLTPREIEILQMIVRVHADGEITDLRECLMDLWDDLFRGTLDVPALAVSDATSLSVLQGVGLVPVRGDRPSSLPFDRLTPLVSGDATWRIVEALVSS